jgi:hypothetical protein
MAYLFFDTAFGLSGAGCLTGIKELLSNIGGLSR